MTALALPLSETTETSQPVAPAGQMSRLVIPLVRLPEQRRSRGSEVLEPWCKLVEESAEPCFVLDQSGAVAAASTAAAQMLGEYGPDQVVGHHLLDVVDLIDFHGGPAGAVYTDRLAPLLAMAGDVLARGLIRVRFPDGSTRTLDAVAAPLHDAAGEAVGAIAFLASIWS
jgi:PAS domain S-box-containing protein